MLPPLVALLALALAPPAPLAADDVYLKNGRSFTGVVVETTETQVRITLPGGSISLPISAVDRVERANSTFGAYVERKQALLAAEAHAGGERHAGDWLELARWARRNGLPDAAREAALVAAQIDPQLAGLAPLLRPYGYIYEPTVDRWVSYDESMRLQGMVQENGVWVSREQAAADLAARRQAQAMQAAAMAAQAQANAYDTAVGDPGLPAQGGGGTDINAYGGDGWPYLYGGFAAPGYGFGPRVKAGRGFGTARVGPPFRQPGMLPIHPRSGGGIHAGAGGHARGGGRAGGVRR